MISFDITPVPKPRMTNSDRWNVGRNIRPPVARYFAFAQELKLKANLKRFVIPSRVWVKFYIPMPSGWGDAMKKDRNGKEHEIKPDSDNYGKAFIDALAPEDGYIWDERFTKYWSYTGKIEVFELTD